MTFPPLPGLQGYIACFSQKVCNGGQSLYSLHKEAIILSPSKQPVFAINGFPSRIKYRIVA